MEKTFTPEDVQRHVKRLDSSLAGVRKKVGTWFVADGIARILIWAVIVAALDLFIDWFFEMDKSQRVIMLGIMIATLVIVAMRRILRPLTTRLTNRAICHEVEKSHPHLADRLTTAMELSRHEPSANISKDLTDAAIEDGFEASRGLQFNNLIRQGRFGVNLGVIAVIILGIGATAMTVSAENPLSIWFKRNILLTDDTWPQDFYLEVVGLEDDVMFIPKGDDLQVECIVKEGEKVYPDELWLEVSSSEIRMEPEKDTRVFRVTMGKVLEDTRARIVGDGGRTEWFDIKLIERPSVVDFEFSAPRPAYVGGVEKMEPGQDPYYILKGSKLKATGTANKPLSAAYLLREDEDGDAKYNLKVEGNKFTGGIPEDFFPGTYTLHLLDTEKVKVHGRATKEPLSSKGNIQFTVIELPDTPPGVRLKLSGVSSMVVPGAYVPFSIKADDDYVTTGAQIDYQWLAESDPDGTDPNKGTIDLPKPEDLELPVDSEGNEIKRSPKLYEHFGGIEIRDLEIPEGSSLTLEGVAFDNDDVSGPKEGRSSKVLLRIVSESELRANLLRREMEDRQALEEITKKQDKVYTETRSLAAAIRNDENVPQERLTELLKLLKRQRGLGGNIGPIIGRIEDIIQEYQNNRLVGADGRGIKRLQDGAVLHLTVILEQLLPEATLQMEIARSLTDDPEGREEAFAKAVEKQSEILDKLRLVLENLKKNEGFQQVINLLHEIAKEEEEVLKATEKAKDERLKGTTKPKEDPTAEDKSAGDEGANESSEEAEGE